MAHVFLFDIDGTLLSSGGAGKAALEEGLASEFGVRGTMEKLVLSGRTDRAIVADLLRYSDLAVTEEHHQRLLLAYLRHLPVTLREKPGRVLPGVIGLLSRLAERQAVVGLVTGNVRAGAQTKLMHYDLHEHFAFGGFGDQHHDRDDVAREAFRAMRGHLGEKVDPRSLWVIGDTPHDVRCARAIGATAVAVTTGWHPREELAASEPDVLVEDLSELIAGGHLDHL